MSMIQAVIFDLDGTVLDTEKEWEDIFRQVWEEYSGQRRLDKTWLHIPGMGVTPNWRRLVHDEDMVQKLTLRTFEIYKKNVADSGDVRARDGVVEAVEKAKQLGWLTALATGSTWNSVEEELEQIGMYLAFDTTTTGEEVLSAKPDPEIYVLTAQKLGVEFSECLVIEDSLSGIEAGYSAGMDVVGIVSEYATAKALTASGAKYVINDMNELVQLFDEIKNKEQINNSPGEE